MWRKPPDKILRPRVGLALSGGAARGIAHIGVIRVLQEHQIPIDVISGTSAGALVGGALAAGMPLAEIEEMGRRLRWRDMGRMTISRLGVQSNARMQELIEARFPFKRFEDLPVPFAAVATDLHTGAPVLMSGKGSVALAIRASCAIPGWYVPVTDEHGRQLIDGGVVANIPTVAARFLGAELVIAVDVNSEGAKFLSAPTSIIGVLIQSMMVVQRTASTHQLQAASIVISPSVGHIRWDEMSRADELIKLGEQSARSQIESIKQLLAPPPEPPARWYQFRRRNASPQLR
jgi:NTE family protein